MPKHTTRQAQLTRGAIIAGALATAQMPPNRQLGSQKVSRPMFTSRGVAFVFSTRRCNPPTHTHTHTHKPNGEKKRRNGPIQTSLLFWPMSGANFRLFKGRVRKRGGAANVDNLSGRCSKRKSPTMAPADRSGRESTREDNDHGYRRKGNDSSRICNWDAGNVRTDV